MQCIIWGGDLCIVFKMLDTFVFHTPEKTFNGRAEVAISISEYNRAETGIQQNWNVRDLYKYLLKDKSHLKVYNKTDNK